MQGLTRPAQGSLRAETQKETFFPPESRPYLELIISGERDNAWSCYEINKINKINYIPQLGGLSYHLFCYNPMSNFVNIAIFLNFCQMRDPNLGHSHSVTADKSKKNQTCLKGRYWGPHDVVTALSRNGKFRSIFRIHIERFGTWTSPNWAQAGKLRRCRA